jgi:hypothetical protein
VTVKYAPKSTITGHWIGMVPIDPTMPQGDSAWWYCAEDWEKLKAQRDKYELALQSVYAVFSDDSQSGDSDTLLGILDIAERALK